MSFTPNKYADFDLATGANDGSSWADAYQSLSDLAGNVSAGDQVACRGTESLSSNVTWGAGGTAGNPIIVRGGYDSNGDFDEDTYCNIDCQGNNIYAFYVPNATNRVHVENFYCYDGHSGVYMDGSPDFWEFSNCKFSDFASNHCINAGGKGIIARNCIFQNSRAGIYQAGNYSKIVYNSFIDCDYAIQITGGDGVEIIGNLMHQGDDYGIKFDSSSYRGTVIGNTIDGFGDDGIKIEWGSLSYQMVVMYNRITNNGGYGIDISGNREVSADYNYFYNNTSGSVGGAGQYIGGDNDVNMAGDGYNDRANDDFNLTGSAEGRALEIDYDGTNKSFIAVGALNPEATGGGRRPRARYIGA